jgi:hypothetical protein
MRPRGLERAVLFVVGGAFVLSIVIGLASGKPFGVALIRAFLSSILFGAIVAAGAFLLRRFVPDLGSLFDTDAKSAEPEEAENGRVVDYTVGEGASAVPRNEEAFAADGSPLLDQLDINADNEETGRRPAPDESAGERAASVARSAVAAEPRGAGTDEGDAIDETLPSLDSLFESEEEETGSKEAGIQEARREERIRPQANYIKIGDARIPNEPGIMAKAIKRVLKQD